MTLIMTAVGLLLVCGVLSWSSGSARISARSNQYTRSVAAAEGAVEKTVAAMSSDYLSGGEALVMTNLSSYRLIVPSSTNSSYWTNWEFSDAQSNINRTCVLQISVSNYIVLTSTYAGLSGYVSTYRVVSDARETNSIQRVVAGVLQDVLLTRIPIFQFAMYSSGDMEISCGSAFTIKGPVHSNGKLYVEPDNLLTFKSKVTAVSDILFERHPLDSRDDPDGSVTYEDTAKPKQPALTLPIGATNTPTAIREIILPPGGGEDPNSPMGRSRYYNLADMLITVTNNKITATSGRFNNFATNVPTNQITLFVSTNTSFYDWREKKTVRPITINIGSLNTWDLTNNTLRTALGRSLNSIYVWDRRTFASGNLGAVRLSSGTQLPPLGLTVATSDPLYIQGHYNQPTLLNLGTTNTSTTLPASVAADAVTVLSSLWLDASSTLDVSLRNAGATTVNAAILAGSVDTVQDHYSGGMENFPRFMETWSDAAIFTYNGSMVKMFPSLIATNMWGQTNVYDPPPRNWSYDVNFNNPSKLPPLTPSLQVVGRGQWTTLAPNRTSAP